MEETIIGVNLPSNIADYQDIEQCLAAFVTVGFDAVEINLEMLPLIIYGQVQKDYVAIFKRVLEKYHLRYTAHIGSVNLRTRNNFELHKQMYFTPFQREIQEKVRREIELGKQVLRRPD